MYSAREPYYRASQNYDRAKEPYDRAKGPYYRAKETLLQNHNLVIQRRDFPPGCFRIHRYKKFKRNLKMHAYALNYHKHSGLSQVFKYIIIYISLTSFSGVLCVFIGQACIIQCERAYVCVRAHTHTHACVRACVRAGVRICMNECGQVFRNACILVHI